MRRFLRGLCERHYGGRVPPPIIEWLNAASVEPTTTASGSTSLTVNDVALILGISARAVRQQAKTLGGRKIARDWTFDAEDIERARDHRAAHRPGPCGSD